MMEETITKTDATEAGRAILITFGSAASANRPSMLRYYHTENDGAIVEARLTTEAGIRYVQMCEPHAPLLLYCFASKQFESCVYDPGDAEEHPKVKATIEALARKEKQDDFRFIKVNDLLGRDMQLELLSRMQKDLALKQNDRIYIDMTGGKRDAAMMMISLVRFLQFQNIQPKQIIYSNISGNPSDNVGEIVNTTHLATIFNLFSAMDIFLKTGAARNLGESIRTATGSQEPKLSEPLEGVLRALEGFSDNLALCQADRFQKAIAKIHQALGAYAPEQTIYPESVFAVLVDRVRAEFEGITGKPEDLIATERWLLNHGLVQQALTLYTDQMPDLIYGKDGCVIAKIDPQKKGEEKGARKFEFSENYSHLVHDVCGTLTRPQGNNLPNYILNMQNGKATLQEKENIPPEGRLPQQAIAKVEKFFTIAYNPDKPLKTMQNGHSIINKQVLEDIKKQLDMYPYNDGLKYAARKSEDQFKKMCEANTGDDAKMRAHLLGLPVEDVKNKKEDSLSILEKVLNSVEKNEQFFADGEIDESYNVAFIRDRRKCCLVLLDYALMKMLRNSSNHGGGEPVLAESNVSRLKKIASDHYTLREGVQDEVTPSDVSKAMENALNNLQECLASPKLKG